MSNPQPSEKEQQNSADTEPSRITAYEPPPPLEPWTEKQRLADRKALAQTWIDDAQARADNPDLKDEDREIAANEVIGFQAILDKMLDESESDESN